MDPNYLYIISADSTLYLYVTSEPPFISAYFTYYLRGITKSARLYIAHASKNSNPGSNPLTTCNGGLVGAQLVEG